MEDPVKAKLRSERFRRRHPDRVKKFTANWRMNNKKYISEARFKKQEEVLLLQAGRPRASVCELCGDPSIGSRGSCKTVFDHNHANGKFRGWLCNRCNRTLGFVKDSSFLLRKMADYVDSDGIVLNQESVDKEVESILTR